MWNLMALRTHILVEGDDSVGLHEVDKLCLGVGEGVVGRNLKYGVDKHPVLSFRHFPIIPSDHRQELYCGPYGHTASIFYGIWI